MKLYHGSKKIVSMPICDHKDDKKDFGEGFYATESEELAREWASADENGGIINVYELDTDDLSIIDLCSDEQDILKWLAIILSNRIIPLLSPSETKRRDKIIREYLPDITEADMIKGYRADDSVFTLCRSFVSGDISSEELINIIKAEYPGEQVLLRTEKALSQLDHETYDIVDGSFYYPARIKRDHSFRRSVLNLSDTTFISSYPEIYLKDAMRCMGELMAYSSSENTEMTEDTLLKMFIVSGYASRFESGDPFIISGMSGAELFYSIIETCGEERYYRNTNEILPENDNSYKCGRLLAYFQWKSKMSFSDILTSISFARLLSLSDELLPLPISEACVIIDQKIRERASGATKLQAYRKRLGLSQKDLAAYSGVNIRTLQQYEIGDKNINRAAADKVYALSRALHCSNSCILENSINPT